jgi:hypothetical protein
MVMRKLVFALAIATLILPGASHAQATLDMTQVTCANYLAMSPDQARIFLEAMQYKQLLVNSAGFT